MKPKLNMVEVVSGFLLAIWALKFFFMLDGAMVIDSSLTYGLIDFIAILVYVGFLIVAIIFIVSAVRDLIDYAVEYSNYLSKKNT